ncbi:hypothetical protein ABID56_000023 [Alkalibacillus flavidus]|uniref:DUF4340 domain-containing protein n=1 Tax=Alkalibacillus flavidus TaxID=546021 RepID=A0ABV2KQT2_9BACI
MKKTLIWSIAVGLAVIVLFYWMYQEPAPEPQTFAEIFTNDVGEVEQTEVLRRHDGQTDRASTTDSETTQAILDDLASMEVVEAGNELIEPDYIVSFDNQVVEFTDDRVMIFSQDGVTSYEILDQGTYLDTIESELSFETVQGGNNSSENSDNNDSSSEDNEEEAD